MNTSRLAAALFAVVSLSACPPELTPEPLEPPPQIVSFSASRTKVEVGAQVTLSWQAEGATELSLEELELGSLGVEGATGSVVVTVTKNSLYLLTVRNARGATQRAVVGVSVFETLGELLLTATPARIEAGEEVTLAWSAPGASTVSLSSPAGAVDLQGQTELGVVTVVPASSTTYTLTAGTRSASVDVTVLPTLLSFTSSTDAVDVRDGGASVTLSWRTANVERVRLLAAARGTLVDTTDAGFVADGSFTDVLEPPIDGSRLFRYELEVSGAGQTLSRTITLPVRGQPAILSARAPRYARAGVPFTCTWTTTGADQVSLLLDGIEVYRSPNAAVAAMGSAELVAPASDFTIEVVASGSSAAARQLLPVEVVSLPTVTLSTNPATVTRGVPFQLTWSGQSVRGVRVYDAEGKLLHNETDVGDTGTVPYTLTLGSPATYRISADNGLGDYTSASLTVTVGNAFVLTPSSTGSLRAGQRVELSWPGGETLVGFPHDEVVVRPGSTGFDDISATGTPITFPGSARDDEVVVLSTTFRAPFYGRMVGETIYVSTNGYLSFTPVNSDNDVDVALPSAKLEPLSLAAFWRDWRMNGVATASWQVKDVGADQVLIVQWTRAATVSPTTNTSVFQIKLWSTGQIDFEYETIATGISGRAGVQGPRGEEGYTLGSVPVSGLGVTFFAPKTSPVSVVARSRHPLAGFIAQGAELVPVSVRLDVVRPEELQLTEALIEPPAAVGPLGRWFEFFNARDTAIDLSGWSFTLPDGGTGALGGQLAPGAVKVFGNSTDPALNDDAGVDVALTGFDINGTLGSFTYGRDEGALGTWSWNNPTTGVSNVRDHGPYRFSTDLASAPARAQVCTGTGAYGSQPQPQRGTPGRDSTCGFGYRWQHVDYGFYDISETGRLLIGKTTSTTNINVDLSAAPFPFFGLSRNTIRVSPDGYLTFDLAAANSNFATTIPQTTAPNSVIAIYADDLGGREEDSGVYVRHIAAGEDPFAAAPHWIFQWTRWSHAAADDLNFQVKLFDDGVIEFHFAQMTSGPISTPYSAGVTANTWIENGAGTQALIINASSDTPGISPFTAYRISPR